MCSILAYCGSGADPDKIAEMMEKTISRGPDDTRILNTGSGYLGFNRLSIMGLHGTVTGGYAALYAERFRSGL